MKIGVMGAGSIGLYVGGMLAAAGFETAFAGRAGIVHALLAGGLTITGYDGLGVRIEADKITASSEPAVLSDAELVLFCVKSGDTEAAATALAPHIAPDATVISLQNGVGNVGVLERLLPGRTIIAGVVPFNVARPAPTHVHCAMEGTVMVGPSPMSKRFVAACRNANVPAAVHGDIEALQWGKLLLNLNNGLSVLSGLPLIQQFSDPGYRAVLAMAMREGLAALDAAGIVPARATKANPRIIPRVLGLPTWLFRIVARQMLTMDASARSSMWDDLQAGRTPEVDFLNGAIVDLARRCDRQAPVNALICEKVHHAFSVGVSPQLTGTALLAEAKASSTTP